MKRGPGPLARLAGIIADPLIHRRQRRELAGLPRIGGLASIPSRAHDLAAVLERIVPQLDRLHLFLHGYESIPPEARDPRIEVVLAPRDTPWRASGKFYGLGREQAPCIYFCFDDDILYPPDYVRRLSRELIRRQGNAIVGVHGNNFLPPYQSYVSGRRSFRFQHKLKASRPVDVLGSGTVAFVSSRLPVDPPSWKYGHIDDIMLAIEAERAGLERVCLSRRRNYVRPIPGEQAESLYRRTAADERPAVEQIHVLMRLMGRLPQAPEDSPMANLA